MSYAGERGICIGNVSDIDKVHFREMGDTFEVISPSNYIPSV